MYAADAVRRGEFTVEEIQASVEYAGDLGDFHYDDPQHHGTPRQRQEAFVYGYETEDISSGYDVYRAF